MFWIKWAVFVVVLLAVFLVGVEFSTLNTTPVTIQYLEGAVVLPLSLVVVCSFAAGVGLTTFFGLFVVLPLRWRVVRLRYKVASQEQTIHLLSQKNRQEAH